MMVLSKKKGGGGGEGRLAGHPVQVVGSQLRLRAPSYLYGNILHFTQPLCIPPSPKSKLPSPSFC